MKMPTSKACLFPSYSLWLASVALMVQLEISSSSTYGRPSPGGAGRRTGFMERTLILLDVNARSPVKVLNDNFLSLQLDPSIIKDGWLDFLSSKRLVTLARGLSPAYLRFGGKRTDFLQFHNLKNLAKFRGPGPDNFLKNYEDDIVRSDFALDKQGGCKLANHPGIMLELQREKAAQMQPVLLKEQLSNIYSNITITENRDRESETGKQGEKGMEKWKRKRRRDTKGVRNQERKRERKTERGTGSLDKLYNFAECADLHLILGLNALQRNPDSSWNSSSALSLLKYSAGKKYNISWELGNEPNGYRDLIGQTVNSTQLAQDYTLLRTLLQSVRYYSRAHLYGPSAGRPRKNAIVLLNGFMKNAGSVVDAVTWQHYYMDGRVAKVEDFLKTRLLDTLTEQINKVFKVVSSHAPGKKVWLGGVGPAWAGGTSDLSNTYAASFLWLNTLGIAAIQGIDVVLRHSFFDYGYTHLVDQTFYPLPDYWLSLVFKRLVGPRVLAVRVAGLQRKPRPGRVIRDKLRIYAHCTSFNNHNYVRGSITIYIINLHRSRKKIKLAGTLRNKTVHQYLLQPYGSDGLHARSVQLNGERLLMVDNETFPELKPRTLRAGRTIAMPPMTIGFYVTGSLPIGAYPTMKCLLIASESAEVLFYWTDPEFELNIQEQYGASQEDGEKTPAFEDSINTLFAPIIISCSTLVDRLGDGYTSFSTENSHTYVLHQFEECLYIAVNGDGEEGEDDLRRKIYVMKKMIEVLFGVVTLSSPLLRKELRPQDTGQRTRLWKHLQSLLETYSRLKGQDQSFLVEAVERLIHPTLCEQCIEFLERCLVKEINNSVERAGEEVLHAFILVHTKLLAFYSSRNASSLTSSDLLALIVMVQNMYPSNNDLEDSAPEDVENISAPDVFYTPEPSPTNKDSGTDGDSVSSGRYEESRPEAGTHDQCGTPVFQFVDPDIQMAEDSLQTLESLPHDPATPSRVFLEVMLKEGCYPMMPHSMYCLPLWPGINLVLLTKIPKSNLAMSIYVFLEAFAKLEKRLSEGLEGSAARGQTSIQDLRNKLDKFIRAVGTVDVQTSALQSVWTEFKSKAFSRGGPGFNRGLVPWCRSMKTQLCGVFRQCFMTDNSVGRGSPQRLSPSLQDRALTMVQYGRGHGCPATAAVMRSDCSEFSIDLDLVLDITYLEEFPGLIHFIYVDRTAGQMIAPSLNITDRATSELGKGPLAHFIKGKIWGLVNTSRMYLQKGYSTFTLRDGDYFFCYFLWFENETGYKLEVKELPILPDDSAPIGMLAWDYYRKLLRYYSKNHQGEVVKCYELLTVHLGIIPMEYILQHCSQLARKLWEPTRIPLL
ncbi:hypothetical protein DPEC_G00033120 [Dallia pectoralis]|uniref:Uncharacterized protein n=1 Tax=Dallia pectoralis TaxID=75939 RepID=A0ACC2HCZ0_DALPE|nr:hypothetical protein DPEC_G00033120 [Dallia pectoralis]